MRIRFIVILFVSMLLILISSIIITYKATEETQKNIQEILINRALIEYKYNPKIRNEIKKSIDIYLAFSKKQAVEITRSLLKYYLIVVLMMSILLVFSVFSITRPIKELSKRVSNILRGGKLADQTTHDIFKPRGSYEVKQLYLSFDRLIKDLKEYEELIGDRERYRGWKEIARVIVHEINNLISPVETYSGFLFEKLSKGETISNSHLNPKVREKINAILLKIEEIKITLAKFRDLAHLPEPNFKTVNLTTLLKNITSEFKGIKLILPEESHDEEEKSDNPNADTALDININKTHEIDLDVHFTVTTDPILLGEILRNLIKNAVESTLKKERSDHGDVVVKFQNRDNITVEISDRGEGIPKEIQEKIFTPGFSTKEGNIGIGLSIVKSLSEQLGIKIEMESIESKGTTFYIILPHGDKK